MDYKTLFPVLEMGFLFGISRRNMQFGLIADTGYMYPERGQNGANFSAYHKFGRSPDSRNLSLLDVAMIF